MEAAYRLVDRLVVVIQDDEDIGFAGSGVVQGFEGHAAREGAVAYQRYAMGVRALEGECLRIAEGGADRVRGVSYAEGVVLALAHLREAAHALACAEALERFLTACKYFMGIGLVAYIEDKFILGGVVDVVKAYDEFDSSETRSEMSGMFRTHFYHI